MSRTNYDVVIASNDSKLLYRIVFMTVTAVALILVLANRPYAAIGVMYPVVWMLPVYIAACRQHVGIRNLRMITLIVGWIPIVWIGCLIWSLWSND